MSKNRELHDSRLGTTDETGHRVYLYPEDVVGPWRHKRTIVYWTLIAIYLILPWIHIGGKQSILLNIPGREFTFFGTTFYGHDAPLLIFLFLGIPFTFGFITSIWGRVWCGWGCPQTVFTDAIYSAIDRFVEGNARRRKKIDAMPMSFTKFSIKGFKWILYLLVTLHISHSFIGYFVGTRELFWITMSPPAENPEIFIAMCVVTGIFLFDFGWFKEQFCIIACPYGRFQSVMMDEHSTIVAYDAKRGEPRRTTNPTDVPEGDCINCYACVKVCPTGIDIRRGTQMECIACTNCIDACDEIMEKVGKEKGLVRYDSENGLRGKATKILRFRNIIYLVALIAIYSIAIVNFSHTQDVKVGYIRGSKTPYTVIKNQNGEELANHYKFIFDHKKETKVKVEFSLAGTSPKDIKLITPKNPLTLSKNHQKVNVFFRFPKEVLTKGNRKIKVILKINEKLVEKEVNLVGPY